VGATGATGATGAKGDTGPGSQVYIPVTQTQAFSPGQVVVDNAGTFALALADNAADAEVYGIVGASGNPFTAVLSGEITGLSGLTAGSVYFLSDATPGLLTTTAPTAVGHIWKPLLIADSATSGNVINFLGIVIGATSHSPYQNITTVTSGYNMTTANGAVLANATTGSFTIQLPTAVGATSTVYVIKRIDTSANVVTVTSAGGTIDTYASIAMSALTSYTFISDGTNWWII
jgi:hypothetical protein